jgi:prophage regulatory protein
MNERLLRFREVAARVGLSRTTIYKLMGARKFPRPLKLSAQCVAWKETELDAWIEAQPRSVSK